MIEFIFTVAVLTGQSCTIDGMCPSLYFTVTKFVSCFKMFIFLNDPFLDMKNLTI